jgi:hypothetical protein
MLVGGKRDMKSLNKSFLSLFLTIFMLFYLILHNTSFVLASETINVKDYIKGKFPIIFSIYLTSLEELDQYEKEFIDLLQNLPQEEQEYFAKEVYNNGFTLEILEKVKKWEKSETPTSSSLALSNIAHVWANEGGNKVKRDELRVTNDPNAVFNSMWDGIGISLFGARNEVVFFNLVLEASTRDVTNVDVSLTELTGPDGASITTKTASGDGVFNYVGRNIELFYVRYLEIRGISTDLFYAGYDYDERHIPEYCRRPHDSNCEGTGTWENRPCHNKFFPEIAVPLELNSPFTISAGTNQSVWGDIYIPKNTSTGDYTGTISITEDGILTRQIPISL